MGVLKNLNYIRQAAAFPCATPNPVIVMEAAVEAVAPVLMNAVTFGCLDIVRMRAGFSPWHARGIKALVEGAIPPEQKDAVNKIYKFVIPIEKALFFMFVMDLTTEFLANWQSNLFKLGQCGVPSFDCHWTGKTPTAVDNGLGGWSPVVYATDSIKGNCAGQSGSSFSVLNGWYWQAFFDLTPKPFFTNKPIGWCETRIHRLTNHAYDYEPRRAVPGWFGNKVTGLYMASGQNNTNGTATYFFEYRTDVSSHAVSGSAMVIRSDRPIMEDSFIPVNCFGNPVPTANPLT